MKILLLIVLSVGSLWAQPKSSGITILAGGNVDISAANTTKSIKSGSSLPGTCAQNEVFINTAANVAAQTYICTSTNTWTQQVGTATGGTATFGLEVTKGSSSLINVAVGRRRDGQTYRTLSNACAFVPTGGTGTVLVYMKVDGSFNYGLTSGVTITPTGDCVSDGTQTDFPALSLKLGSCAIASGAVTSCTGDSALTTLTAIGWDRVTCSGGLSCSGDAPMSITQNTSIIPSYSSFVSIADASTITYDASNVQFYRGYVTLTGSHTLQVQNMINGGSYVLRVIQDGTGSRGLTLGTGCTWKVSGGSGAGAITPSTAAGKIDILSWWFDGTNCYAKFDKDFN